MPIYEYRCEECGAVTEFLQRTIAVPEKVICENCGSDKVTRLLSAANVSASSGRAPGRTCCDRETRCDTPPCSNDDACRR
ncbi:zinc ribbon domain-containing protein [bacterium]|nr:zinc ribbon domain-containing protein [bacterium]